MYELEFTYDIFSYTKRAYFTEGYVIRFPLGFTFASSEDSNLRMWTLYHAFAHVTWHTMQAAQSLSKAHSCPIPHLISSMLITVFYKLEIYPRNILK